MAFGKDANNLNKVASFGGLRAQARAFQAARPTRRAAAPYFVGQYRPVAEEGANPDKVRLIAGAHEVDVVEDVPNTRGEKHVVKRIMTYFPCNEHSYMIAPNQPRSFLCSAGPFYMDRKRREPCRGCDAYWENKGNKSSPHRMSDLAVFTTLHFGLYAKTPQQDKEGNLRMNESTGEPYYEWVRFFPHERKKMEQAGFEIRDWSLLHWPLKFSAFNAIGECDDQSSKCCLSCGSRFSIDVEVYLCQGCGIDLIDPNDGTLNQNQLADAVNGMRCNHCQHVGPLSPVVVCSACPNPVRASIYDMDLLAKRVRNPKTDRLDLQLMGFEGPRPLEPRFLEAGEEGRKPIAHALDLKHIYTPSTLEQQEAILSMGNAGKSGRNPVTAQSFSKPYGAGAGTDAGPAAGGRGPNYGG